MFILKKNETKLKSSELLSENICLTCINYILNFFKLSCLTILFEYLF